MVNALLQKLGLSEKEIKVYLASVQLGPSSVRAIAQSASVNRGTAYDMLKALQEQGLVTYYHKDTHQYFIAEDPAKLEDLLLQRQQELLRVHQELSKAIPQLRSLHDKAGAKPVVKYYDGMHGIRVILQDVIESCRTAELKSYYAYSSSKIRTHVYEAYRDFSEDRIAAGIYAKIVSIGPGGRTVGLDERKWLSREKASPTYTLIFPGKIAMLSVDAQNQPHGVLIEDEHMYQAQKMIFEFIWNHLANDQANAPAGVISQE
jgi:sugar-specific transcriptional regulator TrmB